MTRSSLRHEVAAKRLGQSGKRFNFTLCAILYAFCCAYAQAGLRQDQFP